MTVFLLFLPFWNATEAQPLWALYPGRGPRGSRPSLSLDGGCTLSYPPCCSTYHRGPIERVCCPFPSICFQIFPKEIGLIFTTKVERDWQMTVHDERPHYDSRSLHFSSLLLIFCFRHFPWLSSFESLKDLKRFPVRSWERITDLELWTLSRAKSTEFTSNLRKFAD